MEYQEDIDMPLDQKMFDMIDLIALLHNKTTYYEEVDVDNYKKLYEDISNNIAYLTSYYNDYTESAEANEPPLHIAESEIMARYDHRKYEEDHFSQAGDLYRLMSDEQKEVLCQNIKEAMDGVPVEIKKRQIEHFKKADAQYGKRVEELVL